jgi:hypothetical protein
MTQPSALTSSQSDRTIHFKPQLNLTAYFILNLTSMASGFDRQISEIALRTEAYHSKCRDLWTKAPPPPHLGAPFLFAYCWQSWSADQRRALVEKGRNSVEQSIQQMLSPSEGAPAPPVAAKKMQLLLASCVPELFQEELHEDLQPMAALLQTLWGGQKQSKADRAAAKQGRPKHISSAMGFIDNMPWVWMEPTLSLIKHTLEALDYQVFESPHESASSGPSLSAADNEQYQCDLLLSLRAFWMSYFGLQIFMALSPHFHETEVKLLSEGRAAAQQEEMLEREAAADGNAAAEVAYSKPIHTMKIEEIVEERSDSTASSSSAAAASTSASAASSFARVPPALPAHQFCACCFSSAPSLDLKRCSGCKRVWYCSVSCQKKDRKKHKADCTPQNSATAEHGLASAAAPEGPNVPVD